jgi:NAD(P)H-hydrate epimerase
VREPFPAVIQALQDTNLPVTAVDAPSSWNIDEGPPKTGLGSTFMPAVLVSLTAPKPLARYFTGRHFIGGRYDLLSKVWRGVDADQGYRFVPPAVAELFDLDLPKYEGVDQIVEVDSSGNKL